jgi:hypothetical protein
MKLLGRTTFYREYQSILKEKGISAQVQQFSTSAYGRGGPPPLEVWVEEKDYNNAIAIIKSYEKGKNSKIEELDKQVRPIMFSIILGIVVVFIIFLILLYR